MRPLIEHEPTFDGPSPKLFKEAMCSSVASAAAEKPGVRGFKAVWFSSNRYRSVFRVSDLFEISRFEFRWKFEMKRKRLIGLTTRWHDDFFPYNVCPTGAFSQSKKPN